MAALLLLIAVKVPTGAWADFAIDRRPSAAPMPGSLLRSSERTVPARNHSYRSDEVGSQLSPSAGPTRSLARVWGGGRFFKPWQRILAHPRRRHPGFLVRHCALR